VYAPFSLDFLYFLFNLIAALVMGLVIGLERQFRQHPAGLRTNALVCVGAALFVSLSHLMNDDGSPTRMASYVVSGIGFLGGGVILREGLTVKGMNTAATLWCTAAVGALTGAGFPIHAVVGTLVVLAINLGLRPVARWTDARTRKTTDVETSYRIRVVCERRQEAVVRTILLRHVNAHPAMMIQGVSTQDAELPDQAAVVADVFSNSRQDRAIQDLMSRINIEPGVTAVRWEQGQ
jgi:putative Mg2+ transporter-C (MgtC) family protein